MNLVLSRAELRSWAGYIRRVEIIRWLKENGIVFMMGGDEWPRVDRSHYHYRMSSTAQYAKSKGPDMKALGELQRG